MVLVDVMVVQPFCDYAKSRCSDAALMGVMALVMMALVRKFMATAGCCDATVVKMMAMTVMG